MRQAIRVLRRERAFSAFAILTLGLGIGSVTTIFSVVQGVLLKPLSYRDPATLYGASEVAPKLAAAYPRLPVNASHFRSWQEQCRSCAEMALVNPAAFNLTGDNDPERIEGAVCTWPFFRILGVQPQVGRSFEESEDRPGANRFVVISDSLWRRRLGADPAVVGRTISLDGVPHVVVGVLPARFHLPSGDKLGPLNRFPKNAEIFKPMGFDWPKFGRIGSFNYTAIVRLRPGVSPAQAESEMTAAVADAGQLMKLDLFARLLPLREQITGSSRQALTLLFGAVSAVLLIICVNLGNLMLVRANERSRDSAIRRALGAGARDLYRPVLAESLAISVIGGLVGALLAYAGVRVLVSSAPVDIPRLDEVGVDWLTLAFALGISAGCGILCGLWPAIRATRVEPAGALRSGSRGATVGRSRQRTREWLVGLEVALSTVLLVMAALLGLSFFRVTTVERGYAVERILTADVNVPGSRYPKSEERARFHQRALERIAAIPGVRSAGLVSSLPLKAQVWGDSINKEGDPRPRSERPLAHFRFVSEHYFETMGMTLRQGRVPEATDRTHMVAVVSESAARKAWPGENPLGKRIGNDPKQGWAEVIGVVADIRTESLDKAPPPMVYVPYWDGDFWQGGVWGNATYAVRTAQDPASIANALRAAIRELDAALPLSNVLTMREVVSESITNRRFQTVVAGVFAGAALLLACLGIYGVISYSVTRRTNEIGIRIALGAQASQVSGLVLRQGVRPVLGGLAAGVVGALAAGGLFRSFLFGTEARDPVAIAAVAGVLLAVAALACWAPARRASRIDPMAALRQE
jgi:putative ABC transport system permease protein